MNTKNKIIAEIGHPILRKKTLEVPSKKIKSIEISKIIKNLVEVMRLYNGAGLAANQIFYNWRICVLEIKNNSRYKYLPNIPLKILINPKIKILNYKYTFQSYEGCLSVPNLRGKVERYKKIKVNYYNENAEYKSEIIKGYEAVVYQHEIDHLDGVLFTDKVKDNKSLVSYRNYIKFFEEEYINSIYKNLLH